jgi:hypothetical protein
MTPVKEKDEKITNKFLITNLVTKCSVEDLLPIGEKGKKKGK